MDGSKSLTSSCLDEDDTRPPISAALLAQAAYIEPGAYRLTWPGDLRGVATVASQWKRNDAGEIEAWYTAAQLAAALAAMGDAVTWRGTDAAE